MAVPGQSRLLFRLACYALAMVLLYWVVTSNGQQRHDRLRDQASSVPLDSPLRRFLGRVE
jgi:hypothetical protein